MKCWFTFFMCFGTVVAASFSENWEEVEWLMPAGKGGALLGRQDGKWWILSPETAEMKRVESLDKYRLFHRGAMDCAVTYENEAICWPEGFAAQSRGISYGNVPEDTEVLNGYCLKTKGPDVYCAKTAFDAEEPSYSYEKVDLSGIEGGVAEVVGSSNHACLLSRSGEIYCWGSNYAGKLGRGGFPYVLSQGEWHITSATVPIPFPSQPVRSEGDRRFKAVSVFRDTGCGLTSDRPSEVYCWGRLRELNVDQDRLSDIQDGVSSEAIRIPAPNSPHFVGVSSGGMWGAAWSDKNEIYAWGYPNAIEVGEPLRLNKVGDLEKGWKVKSVFVGGGTLCLLANSITEKNALFCLKGNEFERRLSRF